MYYLWVIAGPALALIDRMRTRPSPARDRLAWLAIPGLVMPLFLTAVWPHERWASPTIGSLYGWSMLFLWGSVMMDFKTEPSSAPADLNLRPASRAETTAQSTRSLQT
jgi:hypothetical protein